MLDDSAGGGGRGIEGSAISAPVLTDDERERQGRG